MDKRMIMIAIALVGAALFSGCYTKIAYDKLSKPEWKEKHKSQYFQESDWGKEWNSYYWSPTTRNIFAANSSQKKQSADTGNRRTHRYGDGDGCTSDCITGCILIPLDIIDALLFGDDDDNSDDNNNDSQDKPQRRRGAD